MSVWSRIANVFRGDRLRREIDEELESHIEEAIAQGRDPEEARKSFGSLLRHREAARDIRLSRQRRGFHAPCSNAEVGQSAFKCRQDGKDTDRTGDRPRLCENAIGRGGNPIAA